MTTDHVSTIEPHGWICDTCEEPIPDPRKALIVWKTDESMRAFNFRFVHKGRRCDLDCNDSSHELFHALGLDGHSWWMHFLSKGPAIAAPTPGVRDMDEFVDALRRAQIPSYEQARPYFQTEAVQDQYGDASELAMYMPKTLEDIALLGARED